MLYVGDPQKSPPHWKAPPAAVAFKEKETVPLNSNA